MWNVFLHLSVKSYLNFTHNDTVLADVDIRSDLCRVDHTVLLDENVVSDVQREEGHTKEADK